LDSSHFDAKEGNVNKYQLFGKRNGSIGGLKTMLVLFMFLMDP
jgi:hypothetical protein